MAKARAWVEGEPRACEFGVIDLVASELALVMCAVTEYVGPVAAFLENMEWGGWVGFGAVKGRARI